MDHIRYDLKVREALRNVVRQVVADAAKNGLPGEHHFFISFDTRAPGVRLSPRMRAQYPEEMTIVLQHQFWDLIVTESGLEVGLSFGGIPEKLAVPFDAIKGFFDPSVQFGLEFEAAEQAEGEVPADTPPPAASAVPKALAPLLPTLGGRKGREKAPASEPTAATEAPAPEPIKQDGMGEVVRLDRFRKN
jgi:hypothetical protein